MADNHIPVDDAEARTEAEATSLPRWFFPRAYLDAANHAADPARADPDTANLPWVPLGPRNIGGRIRCLAQDPINPDTLYAGAAFGGLWKTVDGGDRWRVMNGFLQGAANKEVAPPIGAIGICARSPQHLFIGTGEPKDNQFPGIGLFFSDDGAASLQLVDDPASGHIRATRFERVLVDPWTAGRAWIACPTGLWRSIPGTPPTFADNDHVTEAPIPMPAPPAPSQDVTDVAIDFGDRGAAAPPSTFTVYAAVRRDGIYRAAYDTAANGYLQLSDANHPFREPGAAADVRWRKLSGPFPDLPGLTARMGRIKLALCESRPRTLYTVFCLNDRKASEVFATGDGGNSWRRTAQGPGREGSQADYCLVLEVHPDRPDIVFMGTVDMFRTVDGGRHWEKVINWNNYDLGERGQHADQHAVVFDRLDPRKVWVGNDGGISVSNNLGGKWRVRSQGILAVQFYDITNHPTYPFIYGGGFQDNGTWLSFGGPTWHRLSGGDGGAMGFQHGDPYNMLTTWQGREGSKNSLNRIRLAARTETEIAEIGDGLFDFRRLYDFQQSGLPDIPGTGADGGPPYLRMVAASDDITDDFETAHHGIFGGRLEGHPSSPNHWIMARMKAAYASKAGSTLTSGDGPEFEKLGLPELAANGNDNFIAVTAMAYAPADPDQQWWIGTSRGEVFKTVNGGDTWIKIAPLATAPDNLSGEWITDISVHPGNSDIVVLTCEDGTRSVYITGDGGGSWRNLRGVAAADRLFNAPVTRALIDPRGPAGAGAGDLQTLYVSTFAGIYVARNVTPDPAGPDPVWRTLNTGMPLVLVRDLAYGEALDAGGAVVRRFIRAATYGRGAYQMELGVGALGVAPGSPTTPPARLLVRSTPIDDGHRYFPPQRLTHDPRVKRFGTGTPRDLEPHLAFDIRIDAPPFTFFDRILDGAEFDEEVRCDRLIIGETNLVYVQVHNTGFETVDDVFVHLYFADVSAAPHHAPDLDAGFWGAFPNPPPAGAVWQKAVPGGLELDDMGPAQPRIARFQWSPPITLGGKVALLALVTQATHDDLGATNTGNLQVDPRVHGDSALVIEERRAALRIVDAVPFVPDVFVRDGLDDDGARGSVAWGGRCIDIVVTDTAEADPDNTFSDVADPREADEIRGRTGAPDVENFIYVRVWNRRKVPLSAEVDLYYVPYAKLATPAEWVSIEDGAGNSRLPVANIPPGGSRFSPGFVLTNPPDPAPGQDYKAALLVAVLGSPEEARPDINSIDSVEKFWRFLTAGENANNAACRGLRYISAGG